jgi:plastocyanin
MQPSTARYLWITALAAIVVAGAAMLVASRDDKPREIRVVARDMTFYVDGSDVPNPTLKLRAREQVRITLRNEDAGMSHDFVVRAWSVGTRLLEGKGDETSVEFRAPDARGTHEYTCTPHSAMMKGAIEIE